MRDVLELAGLLLIPAVTAVAVAVVLLKCCSAVAARYAFATATAVGFLAGSLLFPDRLPLVPERHWHWLPYLGIVAAWFGGVTTAGGVQWWERLLGYAVLAAIAAFELVPTYADLKPARHVLIPLLAVYFTAIALLLSLLPERLRGQLFIALLAATGAATSILVIAEISLRIGVFSLRIPVAIAGCWLASWWFRPAAKQNITAAVLALIPVFAVLVGGSAFVGAIVPMEARWLLLAAPAAPLMLWLFAAGPLARLQGSAAVAAQIAAVAIVPIAILVWTILQAKPDEWG